MFMCEECIGLCADYAHWIDTQLATCEVCGKQTICRYLLVIKYTTEEPHRCEVLQFRRRTTCTQKIS